MPAESLLLGMFLLCRAIYFGATLGKETGFDTGAHLEMVTNLSWLQRAPDIGQYFYSYHPPLGFLFAHSLTWLGLSPIMAVQVLNAAASLATFFVLRALLRYVGLLAEPAAIFFLYLFASLPIELFLASSINLDVLIAFYTVLTTYLSVRLFWGHDTEKQNRLWLALSIVAVIAIALLTKFSGLLLTAIPPLTAFILQKRTIRLTTIALAISATALLLVSPYYVTRYVIPTGRVFPTNLEIFGSTELQFAKQARDRAGTQFILSMLSPSPFHGAADTVIRDRDNMRLSDAWQDIWLKEQNLGPMSDTNRSFGFLEKGFASILLVVGLFILVFRFKTESAWDRLGFIWLSFGVLQLTAFVFYLYSQPVAGWAPTKGIYLAACLPIVGYGLSRLIPLRGQGQWRDMIHTSALVLAAILIVLNHLLPLQ